MKRFILCLALGLFSFNTNAVETTAQQNMTLNTCLWMAETAQMLQIGRQWPKTIEMNKYWHRDKVRSVLYREGHERLYIDVVLNIFDRVWSSFQIGVSPTEVFAQTYSNCIRMAKEQIDGGMGYPEIEEYI